MNASDIIVRDFAKKEDFVIVTQDSDFNYLTTLKGFPPKIIWIRSGNLKTEEIADLLTRNIKSIQVFLKDKNLGCLEIVRMTIK